jgi:predicted MFS family arabinose efflux permease
MATVGRPSTPTTPPASIRRASSARSLSFRIPNPGEADDIVTESTPILVRTDDTGMLGSSNNSPDKVEMHMPLDYSHDKFVYGVCYMCCMGVCGMVLVALGSTLEEIAIQCNTTSKAIGSVFLARGIGAIIGAVLSAKLFEWFPGNTVLAVALISIAMLLMWIPFNTSAEILHYIFGLLGLVTAITDTGSQIMTTKVHGRVAGPWLGANTVAFGISGAFVPFIELITPNLIWENGVVGAFIVCVAIVIVVFNSRRLEAELYSAREYYEQVLVFNKDYNYVIEIMISCMVFCFIGGKVTATSYITVYIAESGIIDVTEDANIMFLLWLAIAVGRLAGVYDQIFLTNDTIRSHLSLFCVGGFAAFVLVFRFSTSKLAFYAGIACYGLFNGPCVGYCYDLNNRLAGHTEASVSIVMLGINIGASLVPYFTTYLWNYDQLGLGEMTFVVVIMMSMIIPLPILHGIYIYANCQGGMQRIASMHSLKNAYVVIEDNEGDDLGGVTGSISVAGSRLTHQHESTLFGVDDEVDEFIMVDEDV